MSSIFFISYLALWILLIVQAVLLLLVYRHFGLTSLGTVEGVQRDGLPVGSVVPAFKGLNAYNEMVEWTPQPNHSYLLAFVSPTCGPCQKILPLLLHLATMSKEVEIVLIVNGPRALLQKLLDEFNPPSSITCFSDEGKSIYEDYRVRVMPFAFIVGPDLHIRAKNLCDSSTLENLLKAGGLVIPEGLLAPVGYAG